MPQDSDTELYQHGVFQSFPDELKERLRQLSRQQVVEDKDLLYQAGDEPVGLYGVLSGCIKLTGEDTQGNLYLYGIVQPGWWFGEVAAIDGEPHLQTASAMGQTRLALITRGDLLQLLKENPELYRHFTETFCRRLRLAGAFLHESVFLSTSIRLAKQLLRIHNKRQTQHTKLSQEELAASLGVTRQSIYRVLKEWQQEEWIAIHYGDVEVLAPEALDNFIAAAQ